MKIEFLFVLAALVQAAPEALPQSLPSDNRFFTLMASALTAQQQAAADVVTKRASLEGSYLLALRATETKGLSNTVQYFVADSAVEACQRYLWSVPHTRTDLEGAVTPTEISEALFLIDDSLKITEQTPVPKAVLNVSPPVWTPGPAAIGMDPKSIPDPQARAEYERRIADNHQATEELNARRRLAEGVNALQFTTAQSCGSKGGWLARFEWSFAVLSIT